VNLVLGRAGVMLGLAAAVCAVATLAYALVRRRRDLTWLAAPYAGLVLLGGILTVVAMERALITRDFTVQYVADNGSTRTPPLYNVATLWAALEG
jgi:cytochrome c-type biogenesis protein CcmF